MQIESISIKNYRLFGNVTINDIPHLSAELADEFRDYARRGGQVFVSTHSPEFLNALTLDEIHCLHKHEGFSTITRASTSDTLRSLFDAGDKPGWLWEQRLFEGLVGQGQES